MANAKSVDPSLWWHSFVSLLSELENASLSDDLPQPLAKKLKENHTWFLDTVSMFKPPSEKSKEALGSDIVKIGEHELVIRPELKEKALRISSFLSLDEIQSYILVERSLEQENAATDLVAHEFVHAILLQYYIERQCLLKCTRCILINALYDGTGLREESAIRQEALKLISDGLERKQISVFEDLVSSRYPEQMDVDLFTLWAEETLMEDNLVLDVLFLLYYESFCTCNGERWRQLCMIYQGILSGSYNFRKLAVSAEAQLSVSHAKIQLLLILVETLGLETLLQMVHDGASFRAGPCIFSITDIQEMDAMVSSLSIFDVKEAGSLVLAWAVFLCLIASLPGKEENPLLMEIDHVGYVHQAFEAASLSYFLEVLQSDVLKESGGPDAGYRSVVRTFVSAFIASYEINFQLEDATLNLMMEILCKVYRGEESLCEQFWDRESFVDGPIRCLLYDLEGAFPFRSAELICLLSSLCEGSWPTECVYNFLDKSVGLSTLYDITSGTLVDDVSHIVETCQPLHVPGLEGLIIPSGTRGHIMKTISGNIGLVRWEYKLSGITVLILRLANALYTDKKDELLMILELLHRMVTFNKAVSFSLLNISNFFHIQEFYMNAEIDSGVRVVEIICNLIRSSTLSSDGAAMMALAVGILAKLLQCCPSHVSDVALKANIFDMTPGSGILDVGYNILLSGQWLLSGKLAKMILVDCEKNDSSCSLVISVLELTMQLVEAGLENDVVLSLVLFSLQYILVSHEYWKYKEGNVRWKVTLKVLEVMKACIRLSAFSNKLCHVVRDILLGDTSVHSVLFRIVCTTTQTLEKLCVSRFIEPSEIEGWQQSIASVLDVFDIALAKFSENMNSGLPAFHQAMLSSTAKPIPVVAAITSLISYFRSPIIQIRAVKVLSRLLAMAESSQIYLIINACFGLDDKQITDLRNSVSRILVDKSVRDEDLVVATMKLLTAAARYQPAFLLALFSAKDDSDIQTTDAGSSKYPGKEDSLGLKWSRGSRILDNILLYVERSDDFVNCNTDRLLSILDFFKALWQEAGQYANMLEPLKSSEKLWKRLSNLVSQTAKLKGSIVRGMTEEEIPKLVHKYHFQSSVLEIMACYMFLNKKLFYAESLVRQSSESKEKTDSVINPLKLEGTVDSDPKDIFSKWCSSVLGSRVQSDSTSGGESEISFHSKVASSLLTVHLISKLEISGPGALSVALVAKIKLIFEMVSAQPAFSELVARYSKLGYSEGKELKTMILSDLYCHLQGKLEGRDIPTGPFRELFQFLVDSNFWENYKQKPIEDVNMAFGDELLFDTEHIRAELGIDAWDYSEWRTSKPTAEKMLLYMQHANSMVLLSSSRLSALGALISVLTLYEDNSLEERTIAKRKVPSQIALSSINDVCQNFHATVESVASGWDARKVVFDFLSVQVELLSHLLKSAKKNLSFSIYVLVLKNIGSGLKVLGNLRHSNTVVKKAMKLLLELLLLVLGFGSRDSNLSRTKDILPVQDFAEISDASLGLLPLVCSFIGNLDYSILSLTIVDVILRSFLTPETWFPIIQNHLQLHHLILLLQDKNSMSSVPAILKFLLTIAHTRGGAEMLMDSGFFSTLRILFMDLADGRSPVVKFSEVSLMEKAEKPQQIWGLGLAVVSAMVYSLGGSSRGVDLVECVISYLFSEKAYMILYYLSAPDFPSDDRDRKRPRMERTWTSLAYLKETEHTLTLICLLANRWRSWVKIMKEMDSPLRETSIHLLAFISRGAQRLREPRSQTTHLLCPPVLKEEFDCCKKPSFINSKHGWFSLAPLVCVGKPKPTTVSASNALLIRGQTEPPESVPQSHFSDSVALQIYRVAFLLLKFLCLQAEGAIKRAEEVGFVDLARFPGLPEPEILHGLQDQAISIVAELCENYKSKEVPIEVQNLCLLLFQSMEMSLNLELCVVQICGIRPVLGRLENFSQDFKRLIKATEAHAFLEPSVESLKQITLFVYPGLF